MNDDLRPGIDAARGLDGAAPRAFSRVAVAGEDGSEPRRDAIALAALLAERAAHDADLLILGSRATYGHAGHVAIGTVAARILRGSPSPVLIVPAP